MQLQVEDELILSSIKISPSPSELEYINNLIPFIQNWDYLVSNIIDRGIGPLLYKKISLLSNNSQIPETVKSKLKQVYYKTFSRSSILYEHFRKIAETLTAQNIPLIALKGIYLSEWLYQDIGLRQFSDIDILVKEENASTCISILEKMGYKSFEFESNLSKFVESKFDNDIVHYLPMILNGVSIEIHIKLHKKIEKFDLNVQKLWYNAIPTTINGIQLYALNTNDLIIHICLHLDKHFRSGHIQFTCFNDVTNLLEKYSDSIDWKSFSKDCQFYKCESIVYMYIVLINKYMNVKVPTKIIQKYNSLLTEEYEQLFCNYLRGNGGSIISISKHFSYLNNINNISDKVIYILGVLFPSKVFMIEKYEIKRPSSVFFYYPYRYYIAILGILNYLKKKVVARK